MKHDPEKKRESKGKGKGSPPSRSPRRKTSGKGTLEVKSYSVKGSQPTCFVFKRIDSPKGNVGYYWHPPEWFFLSEKRFGAFEHTEKSGSEPKKRNHSVAVAKTWDLTPKQMIKSLGQTFTAKGDFLHVVSAIPVKFISLQDGKV